MAGGGLLALLLHTASAAEQPNAFEPSGTIKPVNWEVKSSPSTPAAPATLTRGAGGNTLRWRSSPNTPVVANRPVQVQQVGEVQQVQHSEPVNVGSNSGPTLSAPIRQAARIRGVDPFKDPFGDQAGSQGSQTQRQFHAPARAVPTPATRSRLVSQLGDGESDSTGDDTVGGSPFTPTDGTEDITPPRTPDLDDDVRSGRTGSTKKDKDPACAEKPNGVNCCAVDSACFDARNNLLGIPIQSITLNITPQFAPDAETPQDAAQKRDEQMQKAPARVWMDRFGGQIANGSMVDFHEGKVAIDGGNGRQLVEYYRLSDTDRCFVDAWWELPPECGFGDIAYAPRAWGATTFTWKASALCHKPLYFEDVQLERYGHSRGPFIQPLASGAHFFASLVTVPYQSGISPPNECEYALGYYRPGSCAPWMINPLPISARAAATQAAAVAGVFLLFP